MKNMKENVGAVGGYEVDREADCQEDSKVDCEVDRVVHRDS